MKRTLARITSSRDAAFDFEPLVRLWTLRFLVDLELHRRFVKPAGWASDLVARALKLPMAGATPPSPLDDLSAPDDFDDAPAAAPDAASRRERAVRLLRRRLKKAEKRAAHACAPEILASNMRRLQTLVGLNDVEARLLTFAALVHTDRMLDLMSDWIGELTSARVFHVLSTVLRLPEADVRAALSAQGTLARSGLITVNRNHRWNLAAKLDLLSDSFADRIVSDPIDPVDLLRGMVTLAPAAALAMDDFAHIDEALGVLRAYLGRAATTHRRGVNVLIHGEPGTGKTQLARALGGELTCALYEIAGEDANGDAVLGEQRLRAFRAAQAFFAERPVLIAFDEAEDVFSAYRSREPSVAQKRKAWLNRALEDNPVPTVWLSNSVTELDPAFVRRFDLVLHMPVPPARQRERIFREACSNRLSDAAAHRMSMHADLTPGVVARAAGVLGEISDHLLPARYSDTLETLVSGTLEAQGHAPLSSIGVAPFRPDYALDYVNADCDLFALAQGITREQSARLCLYGPPGTGKTAFAAWLAQRMDRALMTRRASDLFSPYVGGTEQNLARAFEEALRDNAVLCLDEGDSFLRERTLSQRSWEVTGVNEMLSQMERFPGVLIVSTNLPDMLDEAALRRFDLKIRFGPLQTAQRRAYFAGRCRALGLEDDADASAAQAFERLDRLDALTLGDFAAVLRRHRMYPLRSASEFVQALAAECALKDRGTAPIGFR